ncbi:MAG: DUF1134 domain-containing protein [Pseudomonadota bacterium]
MKDIATPRPISPPLWAWTATPLRRFALALAALAMASLAAGPIAAQELEVFDPNEAFAAEGKTDGAIDADLIPNPGDETSASVSADPVQPTSSDPIPVETIASPRASASPDPIAAPKSEGFDDEFALYSEPPEGSGSLQWVDPASGASVGEGETVATVSDTSEAMAANENTYAEDDLIGAAEGVFGKGAKGLAKLIEDLLKKEGQPNGYIVGREAGGAFIFGARYGSGTLHHKVEGDRKVYWTGPSVGFDAGANAANTFVLVYNLYDSEDLFKRYPAGEGQAYLVGGLHASYMRRGDVVLIPIRMGAGVRLGVNAGYMKFSKKQRWLPF